MLRAVCACCVSSSVLSYQALACSALIPSERTGKPTRSATRVLPPKLTAEAQKDGSRLMSRTSASIRRITSRGHDSILTASCMER